MDRLEIVGKDELSQQDKEDIKRENDLYLRWEHAKSIYNYDHDQFDFTWRSPADNMYDTEIAKYLDRTKSFRQDKEYTKEQLIIELQKKLKQNEPIHLIIHWLTAQGLYGVENSDAAFDTFLEKCGYIDSSPDEMISKEKLQEIVDRLLIGRDVVFD